MRSTVLALLAMLMSLPAPPTAAQQSGTLSAATQQLFDAVRRKDMGASQAAIAAGADIGARNSLGLRAVDVAIDLGNFEIAHYLLSVSNLKIQAARDAAAQRPPTPAPLSAEPPQPAPGVPAASPAFQVNRGSIANIFSPSAAPAPAVSPAPAAAPQLPPAPPLTGPNPFDVQSAPRNFTLPVLGSGDPAIGPQSALPPTSPPVTASVSSATAAPAAAVPVAATPPPARAVVPEVASAWPEAAPGATPPPPFFPPVASPPAASGGFLETIAGFFRSDGSSRQATVEPAVTPAADVPVAPTTVTAAAPAPAESVAAMPAVTEPPVAVVPAQAVAIDPTPGLFDRLTTLFRVSPRPEPTIPPEPAIKTAAASPPEPIASPVVDVPTPLAAMTEPAPAVETAPPVQPDTTPGLLDRLTTLFRAPPRSEPAVPQEPAVAIAAAAPPEPVSPPVVDAPTTPAAMTGPVSAVETAPPVQPDTTPGLLDRLTTLFRAPPRSEPAAAQEPAVAIAAALRPEPIPAPAIEAPTTPAAVTGPVSAVETAPPVQPDTTPGLLDRLTTLFRAPPRSEPAAAQEPAVAIAAALRPEPIPAPAIEAPTTPAAVTGPISAVETAPPVQPDTTPGLLDRLTTLFRAPPRSEPAVPQEPAVAIAVAPPPEPVSPPVVDAPTLPPAATEPGPAVETSSSTAATVAAPTTAKSGLFDRVAGLFGGSKATETAAVPRAAQSGRPPQPGVEPVPTARTEDMVLGTSIRLGQSWLTQNRRPVECIEKLSWNSLFCVEVVDWPPDIAPIFDVRSSLYRGPQAIVHYEADIAVQVHAVFPSERFAAVVQHFTRLLGAPTEFPEIKTAMIAAPARNNPAVRWHGASDRGDIVLEIRQMDDLRMVLPDTQFGVVRLHRKGADSVFKLVSVSDLMLARLKSPSGG